MSARLRLSRGLLVLPRDNDNLAVPLALLAAYQHLARHRSTVDGQNRPGHVPRLVGGEIQCRLSDIVDGALAFERAVVAHLGADLGLELLETLPVLTRGALAHDRGPDVARRDGIDPDLVVRQLD